MKKTTIFFFMVLTILKMQAQDYQITFAGSGETTVVNTIEVNNLTSGAFVSLNGGDVLHLLPLSGIGDPGYNNRALRLSPNPVLAQSVLTVVAPETGTAVIYILDLSGKTVCQVSAWLSPGTHSFRISGINQGIFFLKIKGESYSYSTKMISWGSKQEEARIEYVSSVDCSDGTLSKSAASTIDMPYTDGDVLLFKGASGSYSAVVTDVPTGNKTITFPFFNCTDSDGNHYATVQIGAGRFAQTWMAENLKVGTGIDSTQSPTDNGIIEYYCYRDNVDLCGIYGGLYQWNEVMNYTGIVGSQGICPNGWHVPTLVEFYDLENFLGGLSVAGGKLKETGTDHWNANNVGATNETGFTALAGGDRQSWGGVYQRLGITSSFWSSSPAITGGYFWFFAINNFEARTYRNDCQPEEAFSCRCIKD